MLQKKPVLLNSLNLPQTGLNTLPNEYSSDLNNDTTSPIKVQVDCSDKENGGSEDDLYSDLFSIEQKNECIVKNPDCHEGATIDSVDLYQELVPICKEDEFNAEECEKAEKELDEVTQEYNKIKQYNVGLRKAISSLHQTAVSEIRRKNKHLRYLKSTLYKEERRTSRFPRNALLKETDDGLTKPKRNKHPRILPPENTSHGRHCLSNVQVSDSENRKRQWPENNEDDRNSRRKHAKLHEDHKQDSSSARVRISNTDKDKAITPERTVSAVNEGSLNEINRKSQGETDRSGHSKLPKRATENGSMVTHISAGHLKLLNPGNSTEVENSSQEEKHPANRRLRSPSPSLTHSSHVSATSVPKCRYEGKDIAEIQSFNGWGKTTSPQENVVNSNLKERETTVASVSKNSDPRLCRISRDPRLSSRKGIKSSHLPLYVHKGSTGYRVSVTKRKVSLSDYRMSRAVVSTDSEVNASKSCELQCSNVADIIKQKNGPIIVEEKSFGVNEKLKIDEVNGQDDDTDGIHRRFKPLDKRIPTIKQENPSEIETSPVKTDSVKSEIYPVQTEEISSPIYTNSSERSLLENTSGNHVCPEPKREAKILYDAVTSKNCLELHVDTPNPMADLDVNTEHSDSSLQVEVKEPELNATSASEITNSKSDSVCVTPKRARRVSFVTIQRKCTMKYASPFKKQLSWPYAIVKNIKSRKAYAKQIGKKQRLKREKCDGKRTTEDSVSSKLKTHNRDEDTKANASGQNPEQTSSLKSTIGFSTRPRINGLDDSPNKTMKRLRYNCYSNFFTSSESENISEKEFSVTIARKTRIDLKDCVSYPCFKMVHKDTTVENGNGAIVKDGVCSSSNSTKSCHKKSISSNFLRHTASKTPEKQDPTNTSTDSSRHRLNSFNEETALSFRDVLERTPKKFMENLESGKGAVTFKGILCDEKKGLSSDGDVSRSDTLDLLIASINQVSRDESWNSLDSEASLLKFVKRHVSPRKSAYFLSPIKSSRICDKSVLFMCKYGSTESSKLETEESTCMSTCSKCVDTQDCPTCNVPSSSSSSSSSSNSNDESLCASPDRAEGV